MKNSQRGFGVVEIILVAVVVLLIGALVYVFIARPFGTKEATTQDTSSKQVAETPAVKEDEKTPAEEPAETPDAKALSLTMKAYSEYRTASIATPGTAYKEHMLPYLSDALAERLGDGAIPYNPFFCAHDVPKSFTYAVGATVGTSVKVNVIGAFDSNAVSNAQVTIDTTTSKIGDLSCITIQ